MIRMQLNNQCEGSLFNITGVSICQTFTGVPTFTFSKDNGCVLRAHTQPTCTGSRRARATRVCILKSHGVLFYETHVAEMICPLVSRWAGRLVASKSKGPAQLIK